MKNLLKGIIICVVALMILNIASASYAQDMGKKLYRGVANIVTGWIELPKNIYNSTAEHGFDSGVFIGLMKGCFMLFSVVKGKKIKLVIATMIVVIELRIETKFISVFICYNTSNQILNKRITKISAEV